MEYQEMELGTAKKMLAKAKRPFGHQLLINGCLLFWLLCCTAGCLYCYYQVQVLHWHLNATHVHVRELERWQRHMCAVRHYNCPEGVETPEYVDDWDWDNFPSMDDYTYDEGLPSPLGAAHGERRKREIIAETTDGTRTSQTQAHKTSASASHKPKLAWYPELEVNEMAATTRAAATRSRLVAAHDEAASGAQHQQHQQQFSPRTQTLETRHYVQTDELGPHPSARSHRRRPPTQRQHLVESFEDEEEAPVVATILRPARRHLPAAHFHGDTSKYALGVHQNYHGNGHLQHLDRTYVDWTASNWMAQTNLDGVFDLRNGVMTVHEDGLYFVYAQIFYVDDHDLNGYHVYRNQEMILQCTTMTHSTTRVRKSNTCYTAGVEKLAAGDRVYVRDLSNERFSLFEKGKSFFGALKLSDVRVK